MIDNFGLPRSSDISHCLLSTMGLGNLLQMAACPLPKLMQCAQYLSYYKTLSGFNWASATVFALPVWRQHF